MTYIIKEDDISILPLSVRSMNGLKRAGIMTVGVFLEYPEEEWINIRNMGEKSVAEIQSLVQMLKGGTGEYVLAKAREKHSKESTVIQENTTTVFLDDTGAVVQDIAIKDLQLSVRAKNSLTSSGYQFSSQLVGITLDERMGMKNMGKKTAEEVLAYITQISIQHGACSSSNEAGASGDDLATEMHHAYGEDESVWLRGSTVVLISEMEMTKYERV